MGFLTPGFLTPGSLPGGRSQGAFHSAAVLDLHSAHFSVEAPCLPFSAPFSWESNRKWKLNLSLLTLAHACSRIAFELSQGRQAGCLAEGGGLLLGLPAPLSTLTLALVFAQVST